MSEPQERLQQFVAEWDYDDNIGHMAANGWDMSVADIAAVLDELKAARARIDAARHSYARVQSRFVAVAHLLDAPFTNRTDVSPWSLIKGDMANLKKALSDE